MSPIVTRTRTHRSGHQAPVKSPATFVSAAMATRDPGVSPVVLRNQGQSGIDGRDWTAGSMAQSMVTTSMANPTQEVLHSTISRGCQPFGSSAVPHLTAYAWSRVLQHVQDGRAAACACAVFRDISRSNSFRYHKELVQDPDINTESEPKVSGAGFDSLVGPFVQRWRQGIRISVGTAEALQGAQFIAVMSAEDEAAALIPLRSC